MLFLEPSNGGLILHNNVMDDALNIDVRVFVGDILGGAHAWLATAESTPEYQANYGKMMQRYPNGLPPYIDGAPVIA